VSGSVLSVNVSSGGLPKHAVESARVGRLGLDGDGHHDDTEHGGPLRAVCLFAMEAIERVQSEGHPVEPGSVGENLTTAGIEWSKLPAGTRARIGEHVMLELVKPASPCDTQRPNFRGGRVNRISIALFPTDSRMYARVLEEGQVRPGDPIELLPAAPDTDVETQLLLDRTDEITRKVDLRLWRAALSGEVDLRILDDGELFAAALPGPPDDHFSHAGGLRTLPHLLGRLLDFYRLNDAVGWIASGPIPWPGAEADFSLVTLVAQPEAVPDAPLPAGLRVRGLEAGEAETWLAVLAPVADEIEFRLETWTPTLPGLLEEPRSHVLVAERDGRPVACAALHEHRKAGLLRTGVVLPEARGQGLQRALIAARARLARELGCDLLVAEAPPGSVSARNLEAMGFGQIAVRGVYRFDPGADPAPQVTERAAGHPAELAAERVPAVGP
jgi:MOSC domain-containing protein YiiM/GNAT superfamily N-acetyltransferase